MTQKITTILFDCDNTLVLSEELAFEACAELINRICASRGVNRTYTGDSLIKEFVGQNFRGMLTTLQAELAIGPEDIEQYVPQEEDAVIARLKTSLQPCAGVNEQLEALAAMGRHQLAVVSSSAYRRLMASLDKVGMDKYFTGDVVFSAATSLETPTSKPDPAIYLFAMKKLGREAGECVAVEDSKSGTLSAVRAGIKTIGYVGPYPEERRGEMEKVLRDAGAVVIMKDWAEFPACLQEIESGRV